MSNPVISRWGLNLFWYRHWYTDKNYHLSLQHDDAINKLLHTFLNFGISFPVNIFIHKYWFKNYKYKNYFNEHVTKYYRIINFKNFITQEINSYNVRIRIENIYQSKIWILKFQHWILVNFYCFTPLKKRQVEAIRNNQWQFFDTFLTKSSHHFKNYKRLKFVFFFISNQLRKHFNYYKF